MCVGLPRLSLVVDCACKPYTNDVCWRRHNVLWGTSTLRRQSGWRGLRVLGRPRAKRRGRGGSGSQTPLSGSQHRRGGASGSSTHGRVCGDQQTLRGRAEDHRPERGAVKITGLQGWHSRSERQNRCNTDQRPEVGAIRIMSAGTGAIRITSAEIGAIDIMKPSRAQSRALDRVAHARPVAHALVAGRWRRAGHRRRSRARRRRGWQS